jgi:cell division protein ZapA (FtsZ GTPase activity inhibitor)
MKERYNIEIAGIQLTILSDEPKEFVESSVAHLDETIRTMTVKNKRCSKLDAAVLCALDFYSEKTKADKKVKSLEAQIPLYEANIRRLKEEVEQLRAASAPAEKAEEKPAPAEKPARTTRRTAQIAIPDTQTVPAEKSAEVETLLNTEAKTGTSSEDEKKKGKLKEIEALLRGSGKDTQ